MIENIKNRRRQECMMYDVFRIVWLGFKLFNGG